MQIKKKEAWVGNEKPWQSKALPNVKLHGLADTACSNFLTAWPEFIITGLTELNLN